MSSQKKDQKMRRLEYMLSLDEQEISAMVEDDESISRKVNSLPSLTSKFIGFCNKQQNKNLGNLNTSLKFSPNLNSSTKTTPHVMNISNDLLQENRVTFTQNQEEIRKSEDIHSIDSSSNQDLSPLNEEKPQKISKKFSLKNYLKTNSSQFIKQAEEFSEYNNENYIIDRIFPESSKKNLQKSRS